MCMTQSLIHSSLLLVLKTAMKVQNNLSYCLITEIACNAAMTPVHGSSNVTGIVPVGQHQHFSCNQGYVLSGPANLKCMLGGQFDNQTRPTCAGKLFTL